MTTASNSQIGELLSTIHSDDGFRYVFLTNPTNSTIESKLAHAPPIIYSNEQLLSALVSAPRTGQLIGVEDEILNPGVAVHPLACCSGPVCKAKFGIIIDPEHAGLMIEILTAIARIAIKEGLYRLADDAVSVISHLARRSFEGHCLKLSFYFDLVIEKAKFYSDYKDDLTSAISKLMSLLTLPDYNDVKADLTASLFALNSV